MYLRARLQREVQGRVLPIISSQKGFRFAHVLVAAGSGA
jgi:hypothetical protein